MKTSLLLVTLFVAVICAVDPVFKYAGTTAGSGTFTYPSISSGVCTVGTSASPYVNFTVSFSTNGVREIAAMAERNFKSSLTVYIYSTFNPASPCMNLLHILDDNQFSFSGGPVVDDFPYFTAGSYDVIVSGGSTGGIFAVNIFPSDDAGVINNFNGNWTAPTVDSDDGSCSLGYYQAYFGTYTFTPASTGYYDLYALLFNSSIGDVDANVVLYQGIPFNAGLTADSCNNTLTNATILAANRASSGGVYIPYAHLTAGAVYTLVFSTSDIDESVYYGVQVIPTRVRFQQSSAWTQPSRSLTSCTASSNTASSWDATLFTSEERAYLLDTATPPSPFSSFDTYSFLYEGSNLGGSLASPFTCPIFAPLVSIGDTGDITPVFALTNPGVNYTVIVSTYGGSSYAPTTSTNYAYVLYLFTGTPIGILPASTSSTTSQSGSTGAGSTGAGSTVTGSTGGSVGSTGSGSTTGVTTSRTTTGTNTASNTASNTVSNTASNTASNSASTTTSRVTTTNSVATTSNAQTVVAPVALIFLMLALLF